ncbi:MAG: hypothetical protein Tsb0020_33810 [Haliangiales bacterium]
MTQAARVYWRRAAWIVGPLCPQETGPYVATSPYVRLPDSITDSALAAEVRVALSRSHTIPDIDWYATPQPPDPVLEAAGVKTWSTFHKGAKAISLYVEESQLKLYPTINEGSRDGFGWLTDAEVAIQSTATLDELGAALKQAFAACR